MAGLSRLANALGQLDGPKKNLALQRALNHTGDKARTQVVRALVVQTGLRYGVIRRAVKAGRAFGARSEFSHHPEGKASLAYTLSTTGGDISLKFFKARETRAGVSAAPRGKRMLFPGSFIKGGQFPNRVTAQGLNGHIYRRLGRSRGPLELKDSGVIIPVEMLEGASAAAFLDTVNKHLPDRVMYEIEVLGMGFFS
ncbi:hypothetical protein [Rhizobium straminoryzae]|nr:hypothetical protein [Rhizobium straminoryzae]